MDKKAMMESLAWDAYERGVFNGLWLYAENGEIVSKGACGFRDAENRLPMEETSIFQLASVTKQFTAAAIMLLARRGLLCLDDDITKFFPGIPYKGATVRHILSHTSGMPDDDDSQWLAKVWREEQCIPSNSIVLRFLNASEGSPIGVPGEKYEYSNPGYCLLAELVTKLSGLRFGEFLKQNIFEPAGMRATGVFHIRRDGVPSDDFVRNMVLEDGGYVLDEVSKRHRAEVIADDGMDGHDYVFTTVFDMLAWDRALREEKVLTLEEQRLMYTPAVLNDGTISGADEDRDGYGFGWGIVNDEKLGLMVNHSGGMPGLGTWYERGVDADRVFIFANTRDYEDAQAYWSFIYGMIAATRDREPEPSSASRNG